MPRYRVNVESPIEDSFRVQQVAGLFDLPIGERVGEAFDVELPALSEAWQIGAIVGPSGSGKTTIAREVFGTALAPRGKWPAGRAMIDGLGRGSIKQLALALTTVGLGSPPAWIKPYDALSTGEQFRADLARALLAGDDESLVVCDEFTSVVDRTVAKCASAALARGLRSGRIRRRFVAVTCHYDVLPWLAPDWTLDMASGQLLAGEAARGCLRRPSIVLRVRRCKQTAWRLFARHHYLSGSLAAGATCYLATWDSRPVAFCAVVALLGRKRHKRVTRIVTLPDYQGLGIGMRLAERVCEHERSRGFRIGITASHPAVIGYCARSPAWRATSISRLGRRGQAIAAREVTTSAGRGVVSFEYLGPGGQNVQVAS